MDDYASIVNAFEELIKYNAGIIEAIGDCPNIERVVNREPVFWRSIDLSQRAVLNVKLIFYLGNAGSYLHLV